MLYDNYDSNDLRKLLFYRTISINPKRIVFRGTYTGTTQYFAGLANNELYFIVAESQLRLGDALAARTTLEKIMVKRYKTGKYILPDFSDPTTALKTILVERRKEFPFTSTIRWEDLRRLNGAKETETILKRVLESDLYELKPGSNRYALPLPQIEINLNKFEQNIR
ncbi:RagB/SusD family nutrient uptake outer membrane protein [Chitinophaga sedimenti]|uniref:RagB/SusD family nutrient uptake outer membrane protein n=1 Tax=Chitinophaga sedimenti TaxID=2033606 RepID=UPI00200424A2|nr:RagB/SusD family nutrient uptake outer membrane protein [Chitinophaga sedimenti]MCK7559453.1 RagB/SusD family nutrient uptake outer membrane protein [Chitinophaga sedimenti]